MRSIPSASGRPLYYDRNPVTRKEAAAVAAGAAVRATTQDWAYTVPSGKKCFVEFLYCRALNNSATAVNGSAFAEIRYQPSGGSESNLMSAIVPAGGASIVNGFTAAGVGLMGAGDIISGYSNSDNSAAGSSVVLQTTFKGSEFDS